MPNFYRSQIDNPTSDDCGFKVAAHATNRETVRSLVFGEVDSTEPCYDIAAAKLSNASLDFGHAIWVPTLAVSYTPGQDRGGTGNIRDIRLKLSSLTENDNIACGGDTGVFRSWWERIGK